MTIKTIADLEKHSSMALLTRWRDVGRITPSALMLTSPSRAHPRLSPPASASRQPPSTSQRNLWTKSNPNDANRCWGRASVDVGPSFTASVIPVDCNSHASNHVGALQLPQPVTSQQDRLSRGQPVVFLIRVCIASCCTQPCNRSHTRRRRLPSNRDDDDNTDSSHHL